MYLDNYELALILNLFWWQKSHLDLQSRDKKDTAARSCFINKINKTKYWLPLLLQFKNKQGNKKYMYHTKLPPSSKPPWFILW